MKALIVEDDRGLSELLAFALRKEGFEVIQAHDGRTGLERWVDHRPDIIVLDVLLPGQNGYVVCKQIRHHDNTPIIMLSARAGEEDVIRGLNLGADDYIAKPFSYRQFLARVQAILRRTQQDTDPFNYHAGSVALDIGWRKLRLGFGDPVPLTRLESRLLSFMISHANKLIPTRQLIQHLWNDVDQGHVRLRQLIHRLRKKIEPDPARPVYIVTVPRRGYRLVTYNPRSPRT